MSSYLDHLPNWAKASFDTAFRIDKLRLPFHSGFVLAHCEYFAELPKDDELHKASKGEIHLPEGESQLARATLSHIYQRALGREGPTAFDSPEAAVQVAAFAHKYAAKILMADCDDFLSHWLPKHLSTQNEKQLKASPFPVDGISAGLETCSSWDIAAWFSWLDFFPEGSLPLLREACSGWLAAHPAVADHTADKLVLLNATTAAQIVKELAQELTWARSKMTLMLVSNRRRDANYANFKL